MAVVWLIGAAFVCGAGGFALTLRTPSWFRGDAPGGQDSRRIAQRLENRIITEAYRFRGEPMSGPDGVRRTGEDWRLRVTEDEATAWLSVKLSEWLANRDPPARLPAGMSEVQAHFSTGRAWLAGRFEERIYSMSAGVGVDGAGVRLMGVRAGIGSLWLPASWGGFGLLGLSGREGAGSEVWRLLSGQAPVIANATIRLEDGRRVRVLGARIETGAIELECRTEVP